MSVALHGNLRDFGIAEVFQLIGQQRKTGTLVVGEGAESVFLVFDEGRVVRGGGPANFGSESEFVGEQLVRSGYLTREQLDELKKESKRSARPLSDLFLATGLIDESTLADVKYLLTRETVFSVIRRKDGNFDFTAESVVHDTKPENLMGAEQILMDGLRMLDEWQTFADAVPSQDVVFCRVGNIESARALTRGDSGSRMEQAQCVLQLIDGRLSVQRIIDLSRIGTFDATRALAELRQGGVIDLASPKKRATKRSRPASSRIQLLPTLRAALAGVIPFLALGFMVFSALPGNYSRSDFPGSAIAQPDHQWIGRRFEMEMIRGLIETKRFETGSYPATLEEIAEDVSHESSSLTSSRLAAYYYVVRDNEVVLLAPAQ